MRRPRLRRIVLALLDPADLDRRQGAYSTALAAAGAAANGGLMPVALDGKTRVGRAEPERSPRIWCRCSPTTRG